MQLINLKVLDIFGGKTVDAHIAEMRRLYNLVKEKPEWLSLEDINMYEKELKKLEKSGK